MKFNCTFCNYLTNDKSNWTKHIKSKKHNKNSNKINKTTTSPSATPPPHLGQTSIVLGIKSKYNEQNNKNKNIKVYKCTYCENDFSRLDNLNRHLKSCNEKKSKHDLLEMEYKIYKTEKENEMKIKLLEEKLKSCEIHIETLKNENKFQRQLIESAGGMIKKSMNTMSYLLLNYNDAPQLKALNDYSIMSNNTNNLIDNLVYYHKNGKFDKYIGDFIVQQYKKDDPKLQSIWSSDIERLNYFIRELINNKPDPQKENSIEKTTKLLNWSIDKKGIRVMNNIIDPLLDYVHNIGVNYINQKNKEIENLDIEQATCLISKMKEIGEINYGIKNKTISNNINKYIAPYFYLNKD
jgi:hypothetical protein